MGQEISKIQAALLILPLGFIDLRECLDHKSDRGSQVASAEFLVPRAQLPRDEDFPHQLH